MSTQHSTEIEPHGTSKPADPIADPGLPPHPHRLTDIDATAARRAERQVAGLFGIAALGIIGFCVAYFAFPITSGDLYDLQLSNLALGGTLGVALFAIGAAAIHWAKKLMPDVEVVAHRHLMASPPEARDEVVQQFQDGTEESGFGRRTLIRRSMIGSMLLLPIPAVLILGDLGPLPGNLKSVTRWAKGVRVVTDVTLQPIKASSVQIGQLINGLPANFEDLPVEGPSRLNDLGDSSVIVVRMRPEEIKAPAGQENWDVDGIMVYSKICTHVGCPISLYEQQTHNLLCPCHQSTFKLNEGGRVVFGPARRSLPQLAIEVDSEGYLVAQGDFAEPVGPSFWERG